MSESTKETEAAEEEVSLVDLLAVLLRYRKTIIFFTLGVTFLAGLYFYALPLAGRGAKKMYTVEFSVPIKVLPEEVEGRVNIDIVQSLNAYFGSVPIQDVAYSACFPEEVKGFDAIRLSTFVRDELLKKRFQASFSPELQRYSISLKSEDRDAAERYLALLWKGGFGLLQSRLKVSLAQSLVLLDRDIAVFDASRALDAGAEAKATLINMRQQIIGFQADTRFPLDGEPTYLTYLDNGSGKAKGLVLSFFASLFVGILLAFCRNALDRIREDPEAMGKLRAALRPQKPAARE